MCILTRSNTWNVVNTTESNITSNCQTHQRPSMSLITVRKLIWIGGSSAVGSVCVLTREIVTVSGGRGDHWPAAASAVGLDPCVEAGQATGPRRAVETAPGSHGCSFLCLSTCFSLTARRECGHGGPEHRPVCWEGKERVQTSVLGNRREDVRKTRMERLGSMDCSCFIVTVWLSLDFRCFDWLTD